MRNAFSVTRYALGLWWREFILFIFFNIIWLILQVPVITGPAATAAMYVVARRFFEEGSLYPIDGLQALRQTFLPSIKWGAVNFLVVTAIIVDFWAFQNNAGIGWSLLRLAWGTIGLGWFAVNLFYWPFWLAQRDRSLVTTLRNGALFILKRPALSLPLVLFSLALIIISVLTTLPLATVLMAWLALISVIAVEEELKEKHE